MGVATHLGIRLRDYDRKIRTFIPDYETMLDEAASALRLVRRRAPVVVELGIGSGALAARCLDVAPRARVIGLDLDSKILALARQRLGPRLTTLGGDFLAAPLPRCDVIAASFSLHHIRTRRRKAAVYRRCFRALRPGGLLVIADCCVASDERQRARDRDAWRAHLERSYRRARAEGYLRAWAKDDVYFPLQDELRLLERAGFSVEVRWRRRSFAVLVCRKSRVSLKTLSRAPRTPRPARARDTASSAALPPPTGRASRASPPGKSAPPDTRG
jgi:tRNA (cmo5U34)-methyltransferase